MATRQTQMRPHPLRYSSTVLASSLDRQQLSVLSTKVSAGPWSVLRGMMLPRTSFNSVPVVVRLVLSHAVAWHSAIQQTVDAQSLLSTLLHRALERIREFNTFRNKDFEFCEFVTHTSIYSRIFEDRLRPDTSRYWPLAA